MCGRCGDAVPLESSTFCAGCEAQIRLEVFFGLRRLADYLAAWAAFDAWLEARSRPAYR